MYGCGPAYGDDGSIRGVLLVGREHGAGARGAQDAAGVAARLARVVESISEGFFTLDAQWRFSFVNPVAEEILERSRDELLGRLIWDAFPEAMGTTSQIEYERAVAEGVPVRFQQYYPPLERWFSVRAYPLDDGLAVHVEDVTERVEADRALRASERRFRTLAETMPHMVWTATPSGEIDYQTEAVLRYTGATREQLAGAAWFDVLHPEDRDATAQAWQRSVESGTPYQVEFRIRGESGEYRWFLTRAVPERDDDGEVVKWYGSSTDIHEQLETASRLREQASLLDQARDAILIRDLDHEILYWNAGAERIYGWTRAEALGRSVRSLLYGEAETDDFDGATASVIERGEWTGELDHRRKDGSRVDIEGRWSLVRDAEGRPYRILVINTDITERKKLLAQFLRAQRMESIGTLAGGIAHDLNNVLAPILLSIGLLQGDIDDPEQLEILDTIRGSAERGAALVRQVLSFARGVEGVRVPVDVGHVMDDMARIVRETFPKGIRLRTTLAADLWPVAGDPTQIHQVLMNLLVNARDAIPHAGTITVSADNFEVDEHFAAMSDDVSEGSYVRLSVSDTGTGMPPEVLSQVFDPFFTTKEVGQGTGLGLSTVAAIVRSHGGLVNVYSEPGAGSTFRVYLPAAPAGVEHLDTAVTGGLPRGRGELVLVVDDENSVRTITKQTLEAFGYRVLIAADGADAVAVYARSGDEVAVVLTDMTMPIMDGPSTVRALRRMNPDVRIIAMSGLGADGGAMGVTGLGVEHFLAKPYTAEALLGAVRDALAS
jgi:PAS domain S-box-containing protein